MKKGAEISYDSPTPPGTGTKKAAGTARSERPLSIKERIRLMKQSQEIKVAAASAPKAVSTKEKEVVAVIPHKKKKKGKSTVTEKAYALKVAAPTAKSKVKPVAVPTAKSTAKPVAKPVPTQPSPEQVVKSPSPHTNDTNNIESDPKMSTEQWLVTNYPFLKNNSYASSDSSTHKGQKPDPKDELTEEKISKALKTVRSSPSSGDAGTPPSPEVPAELMNYMSIEEPGEVVKTKDTAGGQTYDDLFLGLSGSSMGSMGSSGVDTLDIFGDLGSAATTDDDDLFDDLGSTDQEPSPRKELGRELNDINHKLQEQLRTEKGKKKKSPQQKATPSPRASKTRHDAKPSSALGGPASPENLTAEQQKLWNKWNDIDDVVDMKVLEKEEELAAKMRKKKGAAKQEVEKKRALEDLARSIEKEGGGTAKKSSNADAKVKEKEKRKRRKEKELAKQNKSKGDGKSKGAGSDVEAVIPAKGESKSEKKERKRRGRSMTSATSSKRGKSLSSRLASASSQKEPKPPKTKRSKVRVAEKAAISHKTLALTPSQSQDTRPKRGSKVSKPDKILAAEMAMMEMRTVEIKEELSKRAVAAAAASPRRSSRSSFWKADSESIRGSMRDRQEAVGKVRRVNDTLANVSKNAALAEVRKEKDLKRAERKAKIQRQQDEKLRAEKARAISEKRSRDAERLRAKESKLKELRDKKSKKTQPDKITISTSDDDDDIHFLSTNPTASYQAPSHQVVVEVSSSRKMTPGRNESKVSAKSAKSAKSSRSKSRSKSRPRDREEGAEILSIASKVSKAVEVSLGIPDEDKVEMKKGRSRSVKKERPSTKSGSRSKSVPRKVPSQDSKSSEEAVEVSVPGDGWKVLGLSDDTPEKRTPEKRTPEKKKGMFHGLGGFTMSAKRKAKAAEKAEAEEERRREEIAAINRKTLEEYYASGGGSTVEGGTSVVYVGTAGGKATQVDLSRGEVVRSPNGKTLISGREVTLPAPLSKKTASDPLLTFRRFQTLMVSGIKVRERVRRGKYEERRQYLTPEYKIIAPSSQVLKLSSSGVWQKKILTVSREALSVTNPNTGDTLRDVPIALVWI